MKDKNPPNPEPGACIGKTGIDEFNEIAVSLISSHRYDALSRQQKYFRVDKVGLPTKHSRAALIHKNTQGTFTRSTISSWLMARGRRGRG